MNLMDQHNERKKVAFDFLKSHKTAVIATTSASEGPQASTVYYVIDSDFSLYFLTGDATKKFKNLAENNKIAFVVGTGPELVTIQGGGRAERLKHPYTDDIILRMSENLSLKESRYWPIFKLPEGAIYVFKIHPEWMIMVNLDIERSEKDYKEDFIPIIP